jgi:Secretion system C-terminal sorting domain
MRLKYFSLFLLLLLGIHYAIAQGSNCELPAPENLVNTVNNPTFLAYTFSPVQGATGYQVSIIYPSGSPTQTFKLYDPNASSFSATVLNEAKIVRIAAMIGECVSPKYAEHVPNVVLIIVDLVGGYTPAAPLGSIRCIYPVLNSRQFLSCSIPNTVDRTYYVTFQEGGTLMVFKLKTMPSVIGDGNPRIHVSDCSNNPDWKYSDQCNPIPSNATDVCNTSEYTQITKGPDNNPNPIIINIKANPGISLTFSREDNSQSVITNFTIYNINEGAQIKYNSDNQTTQSSNEYKVTPNPFSDHLNITIDTPEKGEVVVNLFDVTGSLRKTVTLPANELDNQNYTIATSDLLAGMYIMQVRTSAGVQQVSKVFKL